MSRGHENFDFSNFNCLAANQVLNALAVNMSNFMTGTTVTATVKLGP